MSTPVNSLYQSCQSCDVLCEAETVRHIREQLEPAAKVMLGLFFFTVITVLWNNYILHHLRALDDDDAGDGIDDKVALIGLGLNGVILLFSLLVITLGAKGTHDATKECAEDKIECASFAAGAGIAFGALILLVSVLALVAIVQLKKNAEGFLWKNAMRLSQLLYVILGFVFLILTIVTAIAAGVIDEVNDYMDDNEETVLNEMKAATPNYCTEQVSTVGSTDVTTQDMTDEACMEKARADLKSKTEGQMMNLGIAMAVVVGIQAASVYFGERAVVEYRNADEDDDDDDDDDEEET